MGEVCWLIANDCRNCLRIVTKWRDGFFTLTTSRWIRSERVLIINYSNKFTGCNPNEIAFLLKRNRCERQFLYFWIIKFENIEHLLWNTSGFTSLLINICRRSTDFWRASPILSEEERLKAWKWSTLAQEYWWIHLLARFFHPSLSSVHENFFLNFEKVEEV